MKQIFFFLGRSLLLLLVLAAPIARGQTDPALREQGVLYMEGNVPGPVMATVKAATTVFARRDFGLTLGAVYPGQSIEIIGQSPEGYLVKGTFRNNTIVGWIRPNDLPTGFDPSVFIGAQKSQERRDAVEVAIANKDVIRGMTPDEVQQSLGRPTQTASRTDAKGTWLTWIFTTYREEPQYNYALDAFGRAVLQTYYVKIPIGQRVIAFSNGVVTSIEEHQTDPNTPGVVTN